MNREADGFWVCELRELYTALTCQPEGAGDKSWQGPELESGKDGSSLPSKALGFDSIDDGAPREDI